MLSTALLIARLLLALVFVVSGVAKLADRDGSRRAMADFGVPASLVSPLGLLLPLSELAVAVALVPAPTAWLGAVGALALLLLFIAGIGANMARGRKPDCRCFGQLHSAPAGWKTLVRNGALAAVAGFVVWQGWQGNVGPSAVAWLPALSGAQLLILAVAYGRVWRWCYKVSRLKSVLCTSDGLATDQTARAFGCHGTARTVPPF